MTSPHQDQRDLRALSVAVARVALIATCLGILIAPSLNMIWPLVIEAPLTGVVVDVPCPALEVSAVASEAFQGGFTKYFEQRYGFRALATRIDNSLSYWVFGEAPPDKMVRVGTNGVLYLDGQINYYNQREEPDAAPVASKFKRAQDLLRARGKVLVVMLLPTKTNVWPEDIPAAWRGGGGAAVDAQKKRVSDGYIDALAKAGVLFVDGRKSVASLPREAVYAKTGRHLCAPASCLILSDALDLARPLLEATVPRNDCSYRMDSDLSLDAEEFDLFRLLNVWTPRPTDPVPIMLQATELVPRDRRPGAMVLGSSFGWKFVREAERTHVVGHMYLHYYLTTLVDLDGGPHRVVALRSKEWQNLVSSTALFLAPVPEEYLVHDGEAFLDAIIDLFGTSNPPAGSVTQ
jgi:hypothetical protein